MPLTVVWSSGYQIHDDEGASMRLSCLGAAYPLLTKWRADMLSDQEAQPSLQR
jgi:hypothetical protein